MISSTPACPTPPFFVLSWLASSMLSFEGGEGCIL
ncbi:putative signal peptide protein [Puccinia sorghi]|uniref:Putative signal peptide protein n=1 Tax=Puccinia sorghi TaxID=27349 RepID=A0A0L6VQK9_9BASI|nr:putative signal peptide protein [Puccinia sorghi]